jgi:hypothetical protein
VSCSNASQRLLVANLSADLIVSFFLLKSANDHSSRRQRLWPSGTLTMLIGLAAGTTKSTITRRMSNGLEYQWVEERQWVHPARAGGGGGGGCE